MIADLPLAVVTGAASGIGRAVAMRLRDEGLAVLAVDRVEAGLAALGPEVQPFLADLALEADRDRLVRRAAGCRHLVNAAGIMRARPILDLTVEDIRLLQSVNVEAVWDLTSRVGRTMPAGGSIVNVSSASAKFAVTTEVAAYAMTKAAVLSLTRSFAYAFAASGVRVNAVCPGIIDTPMQDRVLEELSASRGVSVEALSAGRLGQIPLGRSGSPDECAAVIWFLLSGDSRYLTGQSINVTGGWVTW
jgi:NAD(P)-dependent dehydrogenase (short-subunit alcohol dehydrogenase family)